jgi:hypothetical protein
MSETTTMTVATPKITPSRVRNERSLCDRIEDKASFNASVKGTGKYLWHKSAPQPET